MLSFPCTVRNSCQVVNIARRLWFHKVHPVAVVRAPFNTVHREQYTRAFSTHFTLFEQTSQKTLDDGETTIHQQPKPKSGRSPAHKSSLRRVAAEAELSRDVVKHESTKKNQHENDAIVKVVTAYCAAEQYNMPAIAKILDGVGYIIDPFRANLYPHVIHVQFPSFVAGSQVDNASHQPGDIFIFPSGTVVAWDVSDDSVMNLVTKGLLPAAENPHVSRTETEDLEFLEDPASNKSSVVGERIRLGTKPDTVAPSIDDQDAAEYSSEPTDSSSNEANLILAKIAFSSGLARSVKLAVLESALERYFDSTRSIPNLLSQGSKLPFTREFILRKTGELLSVRAQLNLYSELTDSLPDLFWDSRHELGLEGHFDRVGKALDVNIRIKTLNQKMDYAQEIAAVLRERLSEKHGLLLEWLIIALIAIEVGFEMFRLYEESVERHNPDSNESMMRRWLAKELGENQERAS